MVKLGTRLRIDVVLEGKNNWILGSFEGALSDGLDHILLHNRNTGCLVSACPYASKKLQKRQKLATFRS